MRTDRRYLVAIALLSVGLITAAYGLLALKATVNANQATIKQLAAAVAAGQEALSAQLQLTQALQQQVRSLGGQPLTQPPSRRTTPRTPARSTGSDGNGGSSPAPRPSPSRTPRPSPRPTPSPTPSHSPSPSPTPSICPVPGVCLPPGRH